RNCRRGGVGAGARRWRRGAVLIIRDHEKLAFGGRPFLETLEDLSRLPLALDGKRIEAPRHPSPLGREAGVCPEPWGRRTPRELGWRAAERGRRRRARGTTLARRNLVGIGDKTIPGRWPQPVEIYGKVPEIKHDGLLTRARDSRRISTVVV